MLTGLSYGRGSLLFNELNSDCPESPEKCEFLELINQDCGGFASQRNTFGAYVLLIEADDPTSPGTRSQGRPLVRSLFNLTSLPVKDGQQFLTICGDFYSCDAKFWDTEITSSHPENVPVDRHLDSYLLNGNTQPIVLILIETDRHQDVLRQLPPTVDLPIIPPYFTTRNILTTEKLSFIKQYMTDLMVYGKKTPAQGYIWIEDLVTELSTIRTEAMFSSVAYINREFDHIDYPDLSINRCEDSIPYVLSQPSPGHPNDCHKHPTLLLQPTDTVYAWLAAHVTRYDKLAKYISTGGNCYTSWYSKLYTTLRTADIAERRKELVDKAAIVQSSGTTLSRLDFHSKSFSVGSDDENCDSPDKKRQRPFICSQEPKIIVEVKSRCIFDVMKTQPDLKFLPPITECGNSDSPDGELLPLSEFDDSDSYEPAPVEPDGMRAGSYSTADVIMSRAGFFHGNTHNLKFVKVCRRHSQQYSSDFKNYLLDKKGAF